MKRIILFQIALALTILSLPLDAAACSCGRSTACEAFGQATAVFIGQAISGSQITSGSAEDNGATSYTGLVQFNVEEAFKCVTDPQIEITVGIGCSTLRFIRGERYLVYGYTHQREKGIFTGSCSRTKRATDAHEDLDFLRSLPPPGAGGRLYGSIRVEKGDPGTTPLTGVRINVDGQSGNRLIATTDDNGEFELLGLSPGKYVVTPILPDDYEPSYDYQKAREFVVIDKGVHTSLVFGGNQGAGRGPSAGLPRHRGSSICELNLC